MKAQSFGQFNNKIKIYVHPLCVAFALYYLFANKFLEFILCTLTAVIHELGHSFTAQRLGYRLDKITLMPYGAVVSGDITGLKLKDEIIVALSGPLINIIVGLFFVACWWIYPEIYPFTESAVKVSFSMGFVNLIPIYPLDGGRVISAILTRHFGRDKAYKTCKVFGIVLSIILFVCFIFTIKLGINISLLLFSLFVFFGAISKKQQNNYIKIYSGINKCALNRGITYKKIAVDKDLTIKNLIKLIDENAINELVVFSNDVPVKEISYVELNNILEKANIYDSLKMYI